ncbi:MAG: hypothetical protein JRH08_02565 [Deltaproteobacteria bacterium]|nr:hypothetical protein [Deltaproteobacteria bacterium]MBW1928397.1 hypothetical protein [Deltaproteobacteria bacterium]MBW2023804.1 hypothetical protein [Deltaproteobacteria bacterium]MBW2124583.1 hypothetical protein [Deltaproteobacteria bacterium]RLB19270.1 MAG: hypothetical protein DRG63_01190 [Deltaproteobacteria bacterium]
MGFFTRKKPPVVDSTDLRLDSLIKSIEKFAPRRYRSEREVYYYNYRMLRQYTAPLLELLELISKYKRLRDEKAIFSRELFLRLKGFYDLKDRLSLAEALEDRNLYRRYIDLFLFFYGREGPSIGELKNWLLDLLDGP